MTKKTEEYPAQRDEADPVEKLRWDSDSALSHKVLNKIDTDHPELFDEMIRHVEAHSKHTQVSWVTQNPEKESEHGHQLDPDSTAGKIFLSFRTATQNAPDDERREAAEDVTEYILRPLDEANGHTKFTNYDTKKGAAMSFEETVSFRINSLDYTLVSAMTTNKDESTLSFLEDIKNIQSLSKDLEYMSTPEASAQDFNQRMLRENPDLFNELKNNRDANSDAPNHPSWLTEDGTESANQIFDTFKTSMEDASPKYRELVAASLARTLIYSLHSENYELEGRPSQRQESATFIEPQTYDQIMQNSMDFLWRRTTDVENFAMEAMLLGQQGAYEEAIHDLRDLKNQIENATHNGYSPAQNESQSRDYDHDSEAQEMLSKIKEADHDRGVALHNRLYGFTEFTSPHILQEGDKALWDDLTTDEWTEHPHFEDALREFTTQMLPGDRERLISSITDRPEHSDPDALRERLNAIVPTQEE